jgi:hypothetical protein
MQKGFHGSRGTDHGAPFAPAQGKPVTPHYTTSTDTECTPVAPSGHSTEREDVCNLPLASVARTRISCFPRAGFTQTYRQNAQTCDGMGLLKIWQELQVSPPSVEISTLATPTSLVMAQPVMTKFSPEICSLFRGSSMTDFYCRSPVFDHPIHSQ